MCHLSPVLHWKHRASLCVGVGSLTFLASLTRVSRLRRLGAAYLCQTTHVWNRRVCMKVEVTMPKMGREHYGRHGHRLAQATRRGRSIWTRRCWRSARTKSIRRCLLRRPGYACKEILVEAGRHGRGCRHPHRASRNGGRLLKEERASNRKGMCLLLQPTSDEPLSNAAPPASSAEAPAGTHRLPTRVFRPAPTPWWRSSCPRWARALR